jgi:hypothetical protein
VVHWFWQFITKCSNIFKRGYFFVFFEKKNICHFDAISVFIFGLFIIIIYKFVLLCMQKKIYNKYYYIIIHFVLKKGEMNNKKYNNNSQNEFLSLKKIFLTIHWWISNNDFLNDDYLIPSTTVSTTISTTVSTTIASAVSTTI